MKNTEASLTATASYRSRLGVVVAKDGGWGWIIVIAAFMNYMLSLGMIFSLGTLLTELAMYFGESRYATAWVVSIAFGTACCAGPLVSGLTNRCGCRAVTITGAVLTSFGMVISTLAPNVFYMYFTFGLAVGCGIGMMFQPSVIIVNSYFERRRAIASGIVMCGSGIGTLIIPHVIKYLISYYGSWRSALLVIAGISLNGAVFGSLYRPPDIRVLRLGVPPDEEDSGAIIILEPIQEIKKEYPTEVTLFLERSVESTQSEPTLRTMYTKTPIRKAHSFTEFENPEFQERGNILMASSIRLFPLSSRRNIETSLTSVKKIQSSHFTASMRSRASYTSATKPEISGSGLLYRKDILYSGNLENLPEYRDNAPEVYEDIVTSVVEFEVDKEARKRRLIPREVWDALTQMMDFSLLKDHACQMIILARFTGCLGIMAPYYYIIGSAMEKGILNGRNLISIIGAFNMGGRFGIAFLASYRSMNRLLLYQVCIAITGIMIALVSACYSFTSMAIICALYGFFSGAYSCMLPVILVDMLGIGKLTNSYGLIMLFQGISTMIGVPIPGFLYDATTSYQIAFIFCGCIVMFSALISCIIPLFAYLNGKRRRKTERQMPYH